MNTFETTIRVKVSTLKSFLRYAERKNIKWSRFLLIPTLMKQHVCEVIAYDYNKQCDEEDKVSPELVRFALSGEIEFLDDKITSRCPVYEFNEAPQ